MNCPRCQSQIVAEDVNLQNLVAKCRQCHEVFRFDADQLGPTAPTPRPAAAPAGVTAPRPESMVVEQAGPDRRLTWRWFSWSFLFLLFFCIAWDSFLVFWYSMAFSDFGPGGGFALLMAVFPLIHVLVGVVLTYTTVAGFVNSTVIAVGDSRLTVQHGPLPWPGNLSVPTADVKQLFCTPVPLRNRNRSYHDGPPAGAWTDWLQVDLNVMLADGSQRKIIGHITRAEGVYLEQQLEHWLGIPNRPVPGEVG